MNPKEIFSSRLINSSPEKVFLAFSDSEHLHKWWGPKGFSNTFTEFNFTKNGVWSLIMHGPDGKDYENKYIFLEITRLKKIVIEHIPAPYFILTVTFEQKGDKTRVNWSSVFDSVRIRNKVAKYAIEANEQVFDRLQTEILRIT